MIDRYGEDAVVRSAKKADALLAAADREGLARWKGILAKIDDILTQERIGECNLDDVKLEA
jgi:hypothetical protein